jgi:hypothetical protein
MISFRLFRTVRLLAWCAAAAAAAAATSGCGDDATTPSTPSVTRTTETFSGGVSVGSSNFHSFRVSATGPTDVTLTAAGPPATVVVGLALGTVDDAGCTRLTGASVNTSAGTSPQLAALTSAGTLCVQIRDVGGQTAAISYTVSVTHP